MADKILAKDGIEGFLAKLRQGREVFAPALDKGGKAIWSPAEKAEDLCRVSSFQTPTRAPKEFFFPQTEVLMNFVNKEDDPEGMIMKPVGFLDKPRALMNIRPCDAKAFKFMDIIFCQDDFTDDVYWRDKRENTTLVGLACNDPCPSCFCTSMKCGPHHEEGLDVLLVDLGDKFLARPLTEAGQELTSDLADAESADTGQAAELKAKAEETLAAGKTVSLDKAAEKELVPLYEDPMWDKVFESCLNCGTCTFVCPTCHCFDIQDETSGEDGRRRAQLGLLHELAVHHPRHGPQPQAFQPREGAPALHAQIEIHTHETRRGAGLRGLRPLRAAVPGQHRHPRSRQPDERLRRGL